MPKEIRHVGSFVAVGEDGEKHTIYIFVSILDVGHRGDTNAEIKGMKQLQTNEGEAVNWRAKGRYELVATGEILTSSDPMAP